MGEEEAWGGGHDATSVTSQKMTDGARERLVLWCDAAAAAAGLAALSVRSKTRGHSVPRQKLPRFCCHKHTQTSPPDLQKKEKHLDLV